MSENEIEVPKELREFMLEKAEETFLGQKNGANKQYRYGNLHHNYILSQGENIGYGKGCISLSSRKCCWIYYNTTSLNIFLNLN